MRLVLLGCKYLRALQVIWERRPQMCVIKESKMLRFGRIVEADLTCLD